MAVMDVRFLRKATSSRPLTGSGRSRLQAMHSGVESVAGRERPRWWTLSGAPGRAELSPRIQRYAVMNAIAAHGSEMIRAPLHGYGDQ